MINGISYIANKYYKYPYLGISFKSADKDKNTSAKRNCEPNLSTYINAMQTKLNVDANIKFFVNALCKIDTDTKRTNAKIEILDVGCCDGALCRTLSQFLPLNTVFYGLDLSQNMINEAILKDKRMGLNNTHYNTGNAFSLPYKQNSKDAIILSSVMHELYSYPSEEFNEDAYSKDSILHFMKETYKILKPGGILIIKDPATVSNDPDELIKICNINKFDGKVLPIEDEETLKSADITTLSTYDKLKRFGYDFYPAKGLIKWDKDECIMPKCLITEFIRHRKWLKTPENWAYEIKEQYGTMTPDDMVRFAEKIGFKTVKAENIYIPNSVNFYRINDGEFELKDLKDKKLDLEDFPMFLECVFIKERDKK